MSQFCAKLWEMIADEDKAPKDYAGLKKLTKNKTDKKVIDKISAQEKNHYKKLKKMQKRYCNG